jgi:hypothetical protein
MAPMLIAAMLAVAVGSEAGKAIEADMSTLRGEPASTLVAGLGQPKAERIIDGRRTYEWSGGRCLLSVSVDTADRIEAWTVRGGKHCKGLGASLRLLVDGRRS